MALDFTRPRSGPRGRVEHPADLDGFVIRLRQIGATPDEIAAVVASWSDFTPDYGPKERAEMTRWTDSRLRAEIVALRAEYAEHTSAEL